MFQRQWFSSNSQIGLTQSALDLRELSKNRDFDNAEKILICKSELPIAYRKRQMKKLIHMRKRLILECNKGPLPLRVFFSDFWPRMDPANNQLIDLIRYAIPERQVVYEPNPLLADVSLFTCYGSLRGLEQTTHTLRILFLGENVRPSYTEFDISITSDMSSYCGLNTYLPLWQLEIDWFGSSYPDRSTISLGNLLLHRTVDISTRKHGAIYVGNNHEPFRLSIIHELRMLGITCDKYGSHSRPVEDKNSLCSNYLYAFCPENSYFPGYVTEKLVQAYMSGCIPIYWGCLNGQPFADHPLIVMVYPGMSPSLVARKLRTATNYLIEHGYPCLAEESRIIEGFNSTVRFLRDELSSFCLDL